MAGHSALRPQLSYVSREALHCQTLRWPCRQSPPAVWDHRHRFHSEQLCLFCTFCTQTLAQCGVSFRLLKYGYIYHCLVTIHKRNPVILIEIQLFWNLSWRFPNRFKLFSGFGALFNRKLLDFKSDFCASCTSCIAKLLIINNILFLTATFCRNFTYVAASLMSVYITPFSNKN